MQLSPNHDAARLRTRRLAYASALAGVALAGVVGLGLPRSAVLAQKADVSSPDARGRAPLSFADIVDRVKPAVVSINVTNGGPKVARVPQRPRAAIRRASTRRTSCPICPTTTPSTSSSRTCPRIGARRRPAQLRPSLAQGSGFVISADGYVVTNNHVIDNASKIQVELRQGQQVRGRARRHRPAHRHRAAEDQVVADLPVRRSSPTSTPRVGDWVLAVGNPFGLGGTVTAGIVSAQGRDIGSGPYDYMQIDAAVNRGNSGGPTFNLDGEVVGVNTAIYSPSGGNVGIAFAIPSRTVTDVVTQLQVLRLRQPRLARRQDPERRRGHGGEPRPERAQGRAGHRGHRLRVPPRRPVSRTATPSCRSTATRSTTAATSPGRSRACSPTAKVDVRVLRGQKEQTVAVKLGRFPSGKELAKVETGKSPATEPQVDRRWTSWA